VVTEDVFAFDPPVWVSIRSAMIDLPVHSRIRRKMETKWV
jgi:hypothetical protein